MTHSTASLPDLATRFDMVRDAGVFDYVDRLPPDDELEQTLQAIQRTGLPVPAGSGVYTLGRMSRFTSTTSARLDSWVRSCTTCSYVKPMQTGTL